MSKIFGNKVAKGTPLEVLSVSVDRIAPFLKENQQLHDAYEVKQIGPVPGDFVKSSVNCIR